LESGKIICSLAEEFHVLKNDICYWVKKYREGCEKSPAAKEEYDLMKENLRLKWELEEARKENEFLKNRQHSSRRKSIGSISIHKENS